MTTQPQPTINEPYPAPPKLEASRARLCVVVGLDFTEADGPAFDQAARVAMRVRGSELHLLHVFHTAPSAERTQSLVDHLRLYVDEKATIAKRLDGVVVAIHIRGGTPVRALIQLATEVGADYIVVGSHRGLHAGDWIGGSTVERLVGNSTFPVLVATPVLKEPVKYDPPIEPACPQCVQARIASGGKQWWCDRHSQSVLGAHEYSCQVELPMASQDSAVTPTGIDF